MDAISVLKRTILVVFATLLVAGSAMAQITVSSSSVMLNSSTTFQTVQVTASTATNFTFTITEMDVQTVPWLRAFAGGACNPNSMPTNCATGNGNSGSGATNTTMTIQLLSDLAGQGSVFHAKVLLYTGNIAPAATIDVTFTPGQGPTGSIAVTPTSLNITSLSGNTATNMLTLQNNTGAQITLANPTTNGSSWLSVSMANPVTVDPGGFSVITVKTTAPTAAGTYSDSITVSAGGYTASAAVSLTVVASGLTISSAYMDLSYPNGTSQQVTVSGVNSYSATVTSGANWLDVSPPGTTLTVFAGAGASGLGTGSYTGSIVVTDSNNASNTASISVTLIVSVSGTSITVSPATSLNFFAQANGLPPPYQTLVLSAPVGSFTAQATTSSGGSWLFLEGGSNGGTIPGSIQVVVSSLGSLSSGTYNGKVTIMAGTLSQDVPVSLTIYPSGSPVAFAGYPALFGTAATVLFTGQGSILTPSSQQVTVFASDSSGGLTLSGVKPPAGNWLSVTQSGNQLTLTPNLSGLSAALYSGYVMVNVVNSSGGLANSPISIPVVLTTNGGTAGPLTFTPSQLTFQSTASSVTPNPASVNVNANTTTSFTVSSKCGTSPCPWISLAASGNVTQATLTVTVNAAALPPPSSIAYTGEIDFMANGFLQVLPVSLTVTGSPNTGNITVDKSSLNFTAVAGGPKPTSTIDVKSSGAQLAFSVAVQAAGNWLTSDTTSASTEKIITISADPTSLTPGIYQGTVTITPANGSSPATVAVSFTVQAPPMVSAGATNLTFTYFSGGSAPPAQTVLISGSTGSFSATAASDTGNWLSVTPTSGAPGSNISVSVDPTGIPIGPHTGTVTIAGTNGLTGQAVINVSLTITAPLPSVTSVGNGASYMQGTAAPGEVITLFGTNLGPATAATAQVVNGYLTTRLGGVQVLVSGVPAPMIYASATQVSAVVPYEVANFPLAAVKVKYLGQTSNIATLPVVATAPGIFTQNQSGTGPVGFNGDFSVNGPNNPAAKGSTMVFFLTGEGQTNPAGITGTINSSPNMNPMPVGGITVTIDGQPATYSYEGGIEGVVEGIMQLNVVVPAAARSGTVPILVTIGGNSTQSGVTVSLK